MAVRADPAVVPPLESSAGSSSAGLVELSEWLGRERFAPRAERYDREGSFPDEDYRDLVEHGLTAMLVPPEYGGLGVDPLTYVLVLKNIARGNASTALSLNMHSTLCSFLARLGSEEQKRRFFDPIVREGMLLASAGSEPTASFRGVFSVDTTAEPTDGGYRVNGVKHFCSLATVAAYYLTWTVLPGRSLGDGMVYLAIPSDSPGVEVIPTWDTLAMRSTASDGVRFTDVFVSAEDQIGEVGELIRLNLAERFSLGYNAVYLGVAEAAYAYAHEYAATKSFAPDPLPVSHDPKVQVKIAEMSVLLEAADLMVRRAAGSVAADDERERTLALNQAKYFVGEVALQVSDLALKVVGGRALFRRYPLERHIRDARGAPVMPPAGDKCLETIGKTLFGLSAATIQT